MAKIKKNSISKLAAIEAEQERYRQEIAKGRLKLARSTARRKKLRGAARRECALVIANTLAGVKAPLIEGTYTVQVIDNKVFVAVRERAIRKSEKTDKPVKAVRKGG